MADSEGKSECLVKVKRGMRKKKPQDFYSEGLGAFTPVYPHFLFIFVINEYLYLLLLLLVDVPLSY